MIYRSRKYLTILTLTEARNYVTYDELIHVLERWLYGVVYIERDEILCGLITCGSISRSRDEKTRCVPYNINIRYQVCCKVVNRGFALSYLNAERLQSKSFGHWFLIDEALKAVNFLIIFVVEEDGFLFSFQERFAVVCQGTSDLERVMVVPSGPYILSKNTFPEYFQKIDDEALKMNTEDDITLFAERLPLNWVSHIGFWAGSGRTKLQMNITRQ